MTDEEFYALMVAQEPGPADPMESRRAALLAAEEGPADEAGMDAVVRRQKKRAAEEAKKEMEIMEQEVERRAAAKAAPPVVAPPVETWTQTAQGRGYMGPKISQGQFDALPQGITSRVAPPTLTAAQHAAMVSRISPPSQAETDAAALARMRQTDRPMDRTIRVQGGMPGATDVNQEVVLAANLARAKHDSVMKARALMEAGVPQAEAIAKAGAGLFVSSGKPAVPLSEYQRRMVEAREKAANKVTPPDYNKNPVYKMLIEREKALQMRLDEKAGLPATDPVSIASRKSMQDQIDQIRKERLAIETTPQTPSGPSKFKEGDTVRSKSDPSKLYKIVNGKPVPITAP